MSLFGFDVIIPVGIGQNKGQNNDEYGNSNNGLRIGNKNCNNNNGNRNEYGNCNDNNYGNGNNSIHQNSYNIGNDNSNGIINGNTNDNFNVCEDELVVIDINYFPSYKEVPDFPNRLRNFLRHKAGMI